MKLEEMKIHPPYQYEEYTGQMPLKINGGFVAFEDVQALDEHYKKKMDVLVKALQEVKECIDKQPIKIKPRYYGKNCIGHSLDLDDNPEFRLYFTVYNALKEAEK